MSHCWIIAVKVSLFVVNAIPEVTLLVCLWVIEFEYAATLAVDGFCVCGIPECVVVDSVVFVI